MKKILVIILFLATIAHADRRGQLMNQGPRNALCPDCPPTDLNPRIWLDVKEQKTNALADFTVVSTFTNWGTLGGFFYDGQNAPSPATNKIYRTILGGVLTGISDSANGILWSAPNGDTNRQQYFQTNLGTAAIRVLYSSLFSAQAIPMQSGFSPPVTPSTADFLPQLLNGTWYFDWGSPNTSNRISSVAPNGSTNALLNIVYVKSNDIMQVWVAGTNWLQGNAQTAFLMPSNNAAGPLSVMQLELNTNYLVKRILFWHYALTPSEIANLNTWMTAMP